VFGVAGLLLGYWIGTHTTGTAVQQPDSPRPGHTAPASPGPSGTHTLGLAA
jgi:hypothetical protein